MKKQQFNPEEYTKLKHRVEALQLRVKLDFGPEQETAKRLLAKVEKKLKVYEETHEILKQHTEDYSTTTRHAESSAQIAVEKLRDKCSAEDLSIISTIIQFHEIPRNSYNVDAIFSDMARKNGIPKDQISKVRQMAEVLKDADALDRTRFINKARLNPEFLQYGTSRQLIRFASSVQETYAIQDLKEFQCDEAIGKLLQTYTPQEVLRTIRHSTRANLRLEDIQRFINSWTNSSTKKIENQESVISADEDNSRE